MIDVTKLSQAFSCATPITERVAERLRKMTPYPTKEERIKIIKEEKERFQAKA